jgi:hypothetical protein
VPALRGRRRSGIDAQSFGDLSQLFVLLDERPELSEAADDALLQPLKILKYRQLSPFRRRTTQLGARS